MKKSQIDNRVVKLAKVFNDFGESIYKKDILDDVFPLFKLEVTKENKKDYLFLLDSDNIDFIYQILAMIKKSGMEKTVQYLDKSWQTEFEKQDYDIEKLRKYILFNSPLMEKIKQINDQRTYFKMYGTGTRKGIFRCGQCKQKNTSHNEVQNRRGDEGATYLIYCHNCNIQFKGN